MIKKWTTIYPVNLDSYAQMPTLVNNVDKTCVSQIHAVRDAIHQIEKIIGSDLIEYGSISSRLQFLEDGYSYIIDGYQSLSNQVTRLLPLYGSGVPGNTPLFIGQIYIDNDGPNIYMVTVNNNILVWTLIFGTQNF
ncbi:MAG: hypothetical protein WC516_07150 [Patescibacteria group bacterium]|jgi:hypothetical protein